MTRTPRERYDVIVVGLGAMGSAATYALAGRGARVLGIDRFSPPHTLGSTHGRTRIIREAYYEHPLYVPLVRRAYELWEELERASRRRLLVRTGGLMIGPPEGELLRGARESADEHGLAYELLSRDGMGARYPQFALDSGMTALHEPRAGLLLPEHCVEGFLECARDRGAALRMGEPVLRWEAGGGGVRVITATGEYDARRLVLAAGPWMRELLPDLALPLTVERQLFHWFEPAAHADRFTAAHCPIALVEYGPGRMFATLSDLGDGIKIGVHHEGELVDPERVNRQTTPAEDARVRGLLARYLPEAAGRLRATAVCLYTNTPDHHFIIGVHPAHPEVILASPCSGHGFKFSSVIGEIVAELTLDGTSRFDLSPFRAGRFA